MKAPTDRATTRRVLAGIDVVLRERTAAAVDRVLRTASPGKQAPIVVWRDIPDESVPCPVGCDCGDAVVPRDHATPGMNFKRRPCDSERRRYAPEAVSPHLFGGVS